MRSKLRYRFPIIFLTLAFTFPQRYGQSLGSGSNQYSSYSAYSTLPNSGGDSSSNSALGSGNSVDISKSSDLVSNNVVGVDSVYDQSVRSNQQISGYTPQGREAQGSSNMFHYQMYPVPKTGQMCTYTSNGMKCQHRRDASVGGGEHDSYTAAAASSPSASYGAPMGMSYGGWSGGDESDDLDGGGFGGGGSLSGLAGLIGLLGLKGVKGLKALAPFSIFLPFLPLLLPLLPLLPIILLALPLIVLAPILLPLLLFLPIPVIVAPTGRSLEGLSAGIYNSKALGMTTIARMATDVLESEECVERLSCEIARIGRKYNASSWLEKLAEYMPKNSSYAMKVQKGLKPEENKKSEDGTDESESSRKKKSIGSCTQFTCKPKSIISKYFIH